MTGDRLERVEMLFAEALQRPAEARSAYLDEECRSDPAVRQEVDSLLQAHADAGLFLEHPLDAEPDLVEARTPPRLSRGTRLGVFQITSALGAGGMGAVYRARDTRLDRSVAIKILTPQAGLSDDRLQRFEREARAISRLSHPHICTLYDIGRAALPEAGDVEFLVMELLEGDTLAARLERGPLPLPLAIQYAIEIADALSCAHREGIVHRDLKPQNVMVTASGTKLLDFGLAAFTARRERPESMQSSSLTRPGIMVGTIHYMSPEQIQGREADARADLFSLGLVVHKMVTGRRAFDRPNTVETLNAILHDEPTPLPETVAPGLRAIVAHSLAKDREQRFQTAQDVAFALRSFATWSSSRGETASPATAPTHRARVHASAAVGLLTIAAAVAWVLWPQPAPRTPSNPPQVLPLTTLAGWEWGSTFAPDGERIAFAWNPGRTADRVPGDWKESNWDIYVKIIGLPDVRRLTTDSAYDYAPQWSPDGRHIAFLRSRVPDWNEARVHVMSALGASDRKVSDFPVLPFQISWSSDGRHIAAARAKSDRESGGIYLIPVEGGEPRRLTKPKPDTLDIVPAFAPDGRRLAFASCNEACSVNVIDVDESLLPNGPPRPVASLQQLTWTRDGSSVLYDDRAGFQSLPAHLWRVCADASSPPERVEVAGLALAPAVASTRDRLAFARFIYDVDVYRVEEGHAPQPLAVSSFADVDAVFSPDGQRIAFSSTRNGDRFDIWIAQIDGSSVQQLTYGPGRWQGAPGGRRTVGGSHSILCPMKGTFMSGRSMSRVARRNRSREGLELRA